MPKSMVPVRRRGWRWRPCLWGCAVFLLGVYASFGFALAMPRCAFSDAYLWGGLLVCMAVSVLVGIGPLVVARGKGYRVDVREWLCLAIVVSTPYVVVLCAFDWR